MRVYAETNFVLEMVLEQGEVLEATALVELAERRSIALVLPSAALFETYDTVHRRRTERRALVKRIEDELLQVGRSLSMASEASQLRGTLVRADALVTQRFEDVRQRLLAIVDWIPLDHAVFDEACRLEIAHGLGTPDAIMLASVLLHARAAGGEAIFVTKNPRDFDTPDVRSALSAVRCAPLFKIAAAHARVTATAATVTR
ncbi:PIN domain-containing protein [Sandaracinus amylolyticus]|uniref:PIN domain-containing protein n=1 Tax=Sandaracinus amylolyticus TaxID=927083 RepID=UPI001F2D7583|nr:hypothetical protein [Sandaracinus amylolyticus]UJR84813.1 Hypothetical protein I5071_68920 [Sandaracinus amylolyticus]